MTIRRIAVRAVHYARLPAEENGFGGEFITLKVNGGFEKAVCRKSTVFIANAESHTHTRAKAEPHTSHRSACVVRFIYQRH